LLRPRSLIADLITNYCKVCWICWCAPKAYVLGCPANCYFWFI